MKGFTVFVLVVAAVSINDSNSFEWGKYAEMDQGNFVVKITKTKDNTYICMGSILYAQWVLTTANCLENENITITAGSNWFSESYRLNETNLQTRLVTSKYYIIPPVYKSESNGNNNLGLVYIEEPFILGISLRVSRIWLPSDLYTPRLGEVFSWGERNYLPALEAKLHITHVPDVIDNYDCYLKGLQPTDMSLMCSSGHSSPCYLDEGGPLVATTFKGLTLVGIINKGIPQDGDVCENENAPTHYTSVPYFLKWILDEISFFVSPDY